MDATRDSTAIIQEARICLLAGARIKDSADPSDAVLVLLSGPLSHLHGSAFQPSDLSKLVKKHFDWELSAEAIEFFIPKMRTLGWLEARSGLPTRGPYFVNLPEPDVGEGSDAATGKALADLGQQFLSFAKELSPFQSLPEDHMEAGALLLRYVVDANVPHGSQDNKARTDETFLAARFVEEANNKKLPAQETLAELAAVGFLFRVAEEIARPSKRRRVDLKVVVDAPILLDYLGCSGPTRSDTTKDLFERLRSMGAQTITFEHCVGEARDALRSVLKTNPRDRYGPTGEALKRGIVNEKALLGLAQGFDTAVRASDISILPDDIEFTPQAHKYFDKARAGEVEKIVNWHDGNEHARLADSDTTVLTIRRRAGYRTSDLFDSRYICVTANPTFAGATRRHLLESAYYSPRQVPPVVTIREIAAKLWLELGNHDKSAVLSIPNSQLLMSCDRALRFNRKVVDSARSELAKFNPEQLQQFELLLEVPRSARAVMDVTLNNERYVSGETIGQLVAAAVEAAGEEVGAKAKVLRERDRERFQKELSKSESELGGERARADEHERRAAEHEQAAKDTISAQIAIDVGMLEAIGAELSKRFGRMRSWIKGASVAAAMVPLIALGVAWHNDEVQWLWLVAGVLTVLLAGAAAMDRPGAWLSKLIQGHLERAGESKLRSVGRHDLAETVAFHWSEGLASASSTAGVRS